MTIRGRITPASSANTVLLLGPKGASAVADVKPSGAFRLTVRGRLVSRLNPATGLGPTLHVVRNGKYAAAQFS